MEYVFPDEAARARTLPQLFDPALRCCEYYGGVELEADGDDIGGIAAWLSGERFPLKVWHLIRSGMIATPLHTGIAAVRRLQDYETACEQLIDARYDEEYAYLWSLGVAPDRHGQGLGGRLVRRCCKAMAEDHRICVLKTENPSNVPLYEHIGFRTVYTDTVPSSGLPVWVMEKGLSECR